MVEQLVQRGGLDEVRPAHEGGIVGYGLPVDATEVTQHQAIADPLLGLGITPRVKVLDDEQAQDDLDRSRRSPGSKRMGITLAQIGADLLKDAIIIEQRIEL